MRDSITLPAKPFALILEKRIEELRSQECERPAADVAAECNLPERRVNGILRGEWTRVSFDVADKIVTYIVGPMAWHEDPVLAEMYQEVDLRRVDFAFPVSEDMRGRLHRIVRRSVSIFGGQKLAAHHLKISVSSVNRICA